MRNPQLVMLLDYFMTPSKRKERTLTVGEALNEFGCYALSQRCGDIRRMGFPIRSEWVELPNGKRIKKYFM